MRFPERIFVIALLVMAFALRIIGIAWGQPDPHYAPSFAAKGMIHEQTPLQPDEFLFAALPFKMALTGNLNPKFFETPSFLLNTSFVLTKLTGADSGFNPQDRVGLNDRYYAPFSVYAVNRVLSVLGGLLAVACTYTLARFWGGRYAALVAGLLVTVGMPLVQHAHYGTTSILGVGFMMLTLVAGARCLATGDRKTLLGWLALSAVFSGLALGNRYNIAFVSLVPFVCGWVTLWRYRTWRWFGVIFASWLLFPLSFLVTTPGALYDTEKFVADLRYISNQYIGTGTNQFVIDAWQGLFHEVSYVVVFALGGVGGIAALLGLLSSSWRKDYNRRLMFVLMLVVLLLHIFLINRTVRPNGADQLTLPLMPILCVMAGIGFRGLRGFGSGWRVIIILGMVTLVMIPTLNFLKQLTTEDTRYITQRWIYEHVPSQSSMLLVGSINVPLDPQDYRWTQIFDRSVNIDWATQPAYDYLLVSDALPLRFRKQGIFSPDNLPERAMLLWSIEGNGLEAESFPVYTVDYYHNPTLRLYCLNEVACNATIP